ncbi:MAG: glycosyltransferase [Verrucomicrobiota bacterium]
MSDLSVTIIIAARPDQAAVRAVAASQKLDYPPDKLEILLARGRQPSVQRNAAIRAARGDILYFLDDDSIPAPGNLRLAVEHFQSQQVKMVGGPSLCPADAPALEQALALTMGGWLAFGPSCSRYRPRGVERATSEKELILCNLLARRDDLLQLGGFNESLYPNEENALMDELQKRGGRLLYDPALIVHRHPRPRQNALELRARPGRAISSLSHLGIRPQFCPSLLLPLSGGAALFARDGAVACRRVFGLRPAPGPGGAALAPMALGSGGRGIDIHQPRFLRPRFLARLRQGPPSSAPRRRRRRQTRKNPISPLSG